MRKPGADDRWNFLVNLTDGTLFWLGFAFVSPPTILTVFVAHLINSNLVIGAVPAMVTVAWALPQLAAANYVQQLPTKRLFIIKTALPGRLALILMVIATAFLSVSHPTLTLVLFFIFFGIFRLSGGLSMPAWMDMITRVIPGRLRGRFFGLAAFLGGAISAVALFISGPILREYPFPLNFVIYFSLALFFTTISLTFLGLTKERQAKGVRKALPFQEYVAGLPAILRKDRAYTRFLIFRIVLTLGTMAIGFLALFAIREWGVGDQEAATFTSIMLGSQTIANLAWGALADRRGYKIVNELAGLCVGLAALVALLAPSLVWFQLSFVFVGLAIAGYYVSDPNLPIEFANSADRLHYVALTNTVMAPFMVAAPLIGGLIADLLSYRLLFLAALIVNLIGFTCMVWLVREPRYRLR